MGSLVMHACVAEVLRNKYKFSDKFLLGQLKPDLLKMMGEERDKTHYIKEYIEYSGLKRLPNILEYERENSENIKDEENLGYLCHLIEDRVWFDEYIGKYTKKDANDVDKVIYLEMGNIVKDGKDFSKDMYKDYSNINKYLVEKYSIDLNKIKKLVIGFMGEDKITENIKNSFKLVEADIGKDNTFITKTDLDMYISDSVRKASIELDKVLRN